MNKDTSPIQALLAVITQFVSPADSYRLMKDRQSIGLVLSATVVVIALSGLVRGVLVDWSEVESGWSAERYPELMEDSLTTAQADSVIAGEIDDMHGMIDSLPVTRIVERSIMVLLAGLAALGIAYAVDGKKPEKPLVFFTSAGLSQGAYMITLTLIMLIAYLLNIPDSVRLDLGVFIPTDTLNPSQLHIFIFRFLSSFDIPSVMTLILWGTGLASLRGRPAGSGIRLCFSVYLAGVLLTSLPVMFTSAG